MPHTLFRSFRRSPEPNATNIPRNAVARKRDIPQQLESPLVGQIGIRCKLEGLRSPQWAPKWCNTAGADLQGALYFELQFTRPKDIPLDYAKVRIKLQPVNGYPATNVHVYAPNNGISGPSAARTIEDRYSYRDSQLDDSTPVRGSNVSVSKNGREEESALTRCWDFSSGTPSTTNDSNVTDVEFTWRAGWEDDYDALNRKFRTAMVITQDSPGRIAMSVQVEAKTLKGWKAGPPQERRSGWLLPNSNTDEASFRNLLDTLEADVTDAIMDMTPKALKPRIEAPMKPRPALPTQTPGLLEGPAKPVRLMPAAPSQLPQAATGMVAA